ncbi:uncharacterized protein LOC113215105, partial [Frankliniella occidentalis]|uniref:Uncharacterized protein LOC113215105 n=1 Tax=Frankliniella occidentalis TaxID=133901 RepID=A0A9C6X3K6_FRAOC
MSFRLVALLTLLCKDGIHGKAINSFAGPYTAYIERFYTCENNVAMAWRVYFRTSHFNPQKPRELQRLTGNVTGVNVTLDDSLWCKVYFDVWAQNQWKENAFVFKFQDKACTMLRVLTPDYYEKILNQSASAESACIIKPGIYVVYNTPVKWEFPKIPIMPYGRYKAKIFSGKGKKQLVWRFRPCLPC